MPRITRPCAHCGQPFAVWPSALAAGRGRYCSRACQGKAQSRPEAVRRAKAMRLARAPAGQRWRCCRVGCGAEWSEASDGPTTAGTRVGMCGACVAAALGVAG